MFAPCPLAAEAADIAGHSVERAGRRVLAQTGPGESRVAIARIANKVLALGGECRDQPGLRDIKQRAQDAAEVELANGRHSGQAVGPAARGAAQQVGLDLVFAVMAGQEMQATRLAAPLPEEAVAGRPRHVLN